MWHLQLWTMASGYFRISGSLAQWFHGIFKYLAFWRWLGCPNHHWRSVSQDPIRDIFPFQQQKSLQPCRSADACASITEEVLFGWMGKEGNNQQVQKWSFFFCDYINEVHVFFFPFFSISFGMVLTGFLGELMRFFCSKQKMYLVPGVAGKPGGCGQCCGPSTLVGGSTLHGGCDIRGDLFPYYLGS